MSTLRAPQWLKNMVGDVLAQAFTFAHSMAFRMVLWVLTPILAPVVLIYNLVVFVKGLFIDLMADAVSPAGMVTSLSAGSMLSMANAFFPIDDIAVLLPILVTVSIAAYTYRLVKSYIPTIN